MVTLSDEQFERIETQIKNEVDMRTLQIELLDHYCCEIEARLLAGTDFEEAFRAAFQQISPNGLAEIEEETYFLLTFDKQTTMKKMLYAVGFGASFCLVLGILMKIMHWPNANIINLTGAMLLVATMVVLTIMFFRNLQFFSSSDTFRILSGCFGGLCAGLGFSFKIMHWPGASLLIVIGLVIVSFFFLPTLFWHMYKRAA